MMRALAALRLTVPPPLRVAPAASMRRSVSEPVLVTEMVPAIGDIARDQHGGPVADVQRGPEARAIVPSSNSSPPAARVLVPDRVQSAPVAMT